MTIDQSRRENNETTAGAPQASSGPARRSVEQDGVEKRSPRMYVNVDDTERDESRRYLYNGRLFTGDVVVTDRTGNVIALTPVREGIAHGIDRNWYSDGTLKTETMVVNGGVVESSRHWHANGQLAEERIFDDKGGLQKVLRWAEDGTPVPMQPQR